MVIILLAQPVMLAINLAATRSLSLITVVTIRTSLLLTLVILKLGLLAAKRRRVAGSPPLAAPAGLPESRPLAIPSDFPVQLAASRPITQAVQRLPPVMPAVNRVVAAEAAAPWARRPSSTTFCF